MNLNSYLQFLQEINYIFSGDNKTYNIDKFKNDENGKLFIVGLSGSGKTTFGQNVARSFNAKYVNLDEVDRQHRNEITKEIGQKEIRDPEVVKRVRNKMYNFLQTLEGKPGKYVIEGVTILYLDYNFFKNKPVIILGTSVLLSSLRSYKRDNTAIRDLYTNQKSFIKYLKLFEKFMEGK